jgi:hypothetical protein
VDIAVDNPVDRRRAGCGLLPLHVVRDGLLRVFMMFKLELLVAGVARETLDGGALGCSQSSTRAKSTTSSMVARPKAAASRLYSASLV